MINLLVALIVLCIVGGVLAYVARTLLAAFGVAQPWGGVAYALICLLLLILFLGYAGVGGPWLGAPHAWRVC